MRHIPTIVVLALACLQSAAAATTESAPTQLRRLGYFEPNRGQTDSRYDFLMSRDRCRVLLSGAEVLFAPDDGDPIRLKFETATKEARGEGREPLAGTVNYYPSQRRDGWIEGVPVFGRVRYRSVWPGIDVEYYERDGRLEFDFLLAAGADADSIRLRFPGAGDMAITESGDLRLGRQLRLKAPTAYQERRGKRTSVASAWRVDNLGRASIRLGEWDRNAPLVIDPLVVMLTSAPEQRLFAFAVAANDDIVTTGSVDNQALIERRRPDGALVFSTRLGKGPSGSFVTWVSIASDGAILASGNTFANDFPTLPGPSPNMFGTIILKLAPDGHLASSYVLPGVTAGAAGSGSDGNIIVAGLVQDGLSRFLKTTPDAIQPAYGGGVYDGFLARFSPSTGSVTYASFYGGASADHINSMAIDRQGFVYVAGYSCAASGFPKTDSLAMGFRGACKGYLTKLTPDLKGIVFSAVLPESTAVAKQVGVDASGQIWITMNTAASDWPVTSGAIFRDWSKDQSSAILKLSADGKKVLYGSYLGPISSRNLAVSDDGVYLAGFGGAWLVAGSAGFPQSPGSNSFLLKLTPDGEIDFSTGPNGIGGIPTGIFIGSQRRVWMLVQGAGGFPGDAGGWDVRFNYSRSTVVRVDRPSLVPASVEIVSGDGQTGVLNTLTSSPLVVEVRDKEGRPVSGAGVVFRTQRAGAEPRLAYTDASGRAGVRLLLDQAPGRLEVIATVATLSPVRFGIQVRMPPQAGSPASIAARLPAYSISTVAGTPLRTRIPALAEPLTTPMGIATSGGRIYFTERALRRIREIDADGNLKTIAGTGADGTAGDGGPAAAAQFRDPVALSADAAGNLYVADRAANTIRRIDAQSGVIRQWAQVQQPDAICVDPSGNAFVASTGYRILYRVKPSGEAAPFPSSTLPYNPVRVACDGQGRVYVSYTSGGSAGIVRFKPDGTSEPVAGGVPFRATPDSGRALQESLGQVRALAVAADGTVFLSSLGGGLYRVQTDGTYQRMWRSSILGQVEFASLDAAGTLYLTDSVLQRLFKAEPNKDLAPFAGGDPPSGVPATSAPLYWPYGIAMDPASQTLYIADTGSRRIRTLDKSGVLRTVFGDGVESSLNNKTNFRIPEPVAIATAPSGGYAFNGLTRLWIMKPGQDPRAHELAAFADSLLGPLAFDREGSYYFANSTRFVNLGDSSFGGRVIRSDGMRDLVLGGAWGGLPNGFLPSGYAFFSNGDMAIADSGTHSIWRLDARGVVTRIAGDGTAGYGGDGVAATSARLNQPVGLSFDPEGNLFLADSGNHCIRLIDTRGVIRTVAGSRAGGFGGDGGPALAAKLSSPHGVAAAGNGDLYIADAGNSAIRKLSRLPQETPVELLTNAASLKVSAPAPGAMVFLDGSDFAPGVASAAEGPLPAALAGVMVSIRDSANLDHDAALVSVSPGRLQFVVPLGVAPGIAKLTVRPADGGEATLNTRIDNVSPGVFTANASGSGAPSGSLETTNEAGETSSQPLADCSAGRGRCQPAPIPLAPAGTSQVLVVEMTGVSTAPPETLSVTIGDFPAEVLSFAPGVREGVDVLRIAIPESARGMGDAPLIVRVGGVAANPVTLRFQ